MPKSVAGAQALPVELDPPRIAAREHDVRRERVGTQAAGKPDACCIRIEPDQRSVAAGARGESLRTHVERLEQIRLAGAVRAVEKHDPGLQAQLERGVRTEVAKRDVADDQPASRMGMIRYEKLSSGAAMRPGRSRLMSLRCTVSPADRLEPVPQEVRVEADLELLAGELHRQGLDRLADILRLRRDRELALREAQAKRRVSLGHEPCTTDDLEQRRPRCRDLDLEGLRQKLLVVRELPVDASAGQPDVAGTEDHVVLVDAELDVLGARRDANELLEGSRRDDRLEIGAAGGQRRLLDREPIRVGRGHHELVAFEADEDPREHRS